MRELTTRILRHPLETVLCCLLVAMVSAIFSQVVARYVFESPLSWSEELARFLLMWLSMLSAAYAFKTKSHFALRIAVQKLPQSVQRFVSLAVYLIVALFLAVFCWFSVVFVAGVDGHLAPALQIPMEIPYSSAIVGSALMCYYTLKNGWQALKGCAGPG